MKETKIANVGGQAIIEGLLMMGPKNAAIAVRKPDGEIIVDIKSLPQKSIFSKIPVIRGVVGFVRQMVIGVKALMYSAEFIDIDDEENDKPSKVDAFIEKVFGDRLKDAAIYFSVLVALAFSVGLFILLPNLLASIMNFNKETRGGVVLYNLFEGIIRMSLFFTYIILVSRLQDIRRIWEYHGAEHKTIHCYEHGEELTVDNVKKYTTRHPRCGTSFLFLVMIVSVLVFSFIGWHSVWINILSRLLFIPIVAGISYEILKFAGRSKWKLVKIINAPGLAFQYFTTREPDDSQIEVAIEAFKNVQVSDENGEK